MSFYTYIYNLYINESPRNGKNNKSLRNHHQNTNERGRRRRPRAGTPGAGGTRRRRRTLSFVYGLIKHVELHCFRCRWRRKHTGTYKEGEVNGELNINDIYIYIYMSRLFYWVNIFLYRVQLSMWKIEIIDR